jgi:hypothetical protein
MTDKTLGDILEEALFNGTAFKSGRTDNFAYPDTTQEEVDWESRTYAYSEEGDLFLPPSLFERVSEFGSATVMGRGKDLDYLIWSSDTSEALKYLLAQGWKYTGTEQHYCAVHTDISFTTFRCIDNIYNLVLLEDLDDYKRMMKANDLCVKLKLENKEDRIAVFDAMTRKCDYRGI